MAHDGLKDLDGPIQRYMGSPKARHGGLAREGVYYEGKDLLLWIVSGGWAASSEVAFMNVIEELKKQLDTAASLWDAYKARSDQFRSTVKNDLSSFEAAANKTTAATHRMTKAYGEVIAQMNSTEMLKAIENAERLAAAMESLSKLQSHRLVLSVAEQTTDAK